MLGVQLLLWARTSGEGEQCHGTKGDDGAHGRPCVREIYCIEHEQHARLVAQCGTHRRVHRRLLPPVTRSCVKRCRTSYSLSQLQAGVSPVSIAVVKASVRTFSVPAATCTLTSTEGASGVVVLIFHNQLAKGN
jgi:hypothetical protein